jgi:NADH:ubiquinone oxidoreductase subunit K
MQSPARETRALPNQIRCAMTPTLQLFLIVSAALFCIGLLAALSRRHAIFILIGIEIMLAAANLNFIAFWRFSPERHQPTGVMIAIFSIAIAAAEAAVGLALVISVYRHYRTTNVDQLDQLKG